MTSDKKTPSPGDHAPAARAAGRAAAQDLCAFINRSPTPYHAVAEVERRLVAGGFCELLEGEAWVLAPGDRRYIKRSDATIVAFVVGDESPATGGFSLIGAHTDSPNLRAKPNPDLSRSGYRQVGVEIYGGVLLSTWLDRDLSVAGRLTLNRGGRLETKLVDLERAVARIPNLAIHLNRGVNSDGLVLNAQKHMVPVVGLASEASFLDEVGRAAGEDARDVLGFDLCFYDTTKAALSGLDEEFVFSSRLDNLASCHAAVTALLARAGASPRTRVVVLYDHEECGSRSAQGAAGTVLRDTLTRLVEAHPDKQPQALHRALSRSILVSADMAHAVHPNYPDQHDKHHAPEINRGLVIKTNANQSYATDGATAAWFEGRCREAGFTPQRFAVRTDLPCGSTIGPITAAALGVKTVDVGAPMLSMHSCREMSGTLDVHLAIEAYKQALA